MPFFTNRVRVESMYNYLPWPSNMRTADHVLGMRIQEGAAGYGIYVMLLELLRDSETRALVFNPRNLAFAINEPDTSLVERVVKEYGLFIMAEDGTFTSPWLEEQMAEYDEKKRAAVEAGKKGAARRYGKKETDKASNDNNPIGTLCPPPSVPHGNITKYNDTNEIKPTKSKLLGLQWMDMTGKDLFDLARTDTSKVDEITRQWAEGKQKELDEQRGRNKHNLGAILDVCDKWHLGGGMFAWLLKYTNYAQIGSVQIRNVLEMDARMKKENFTPKYPAEYFLVKLIEQ